MGITWSPGDPYLVSRMAELEKLPEVSGGGLVDAVSYSAVAITIGLFSAGILTCRQIHNSKSVGAVPYLPFLAASINCSLWLLYGLKKPDFSITVVNTVGLFLQLSYTFIYHTYVDNKYYIRRDFAVAATIVLSVVAYYSVFASNPSTIITQLGLICNFFTICFFASPLATMAEVVKSQCTETMSFPLSVMSFLCTLSWTVYGYLISDMYVLFPNFIGLLLSLVQLSLFALYKKKKTISLESPA